MIHNFARAVVRTVGWLFGRVEVVPPDPPQLFERIDLDDPVDEHFDSAKAVLTPDDDSIPTAAERECFNRNRLHWPVEALHQLNDDFEAVLGDDLMDEWAELEQHLMGGGL